MSLKANPKRKEHTFLRKRSQDIGLYASLIGYYLSPVNQPALLPTTCLCPTHSCCFLNVYTFCKFCFCLVQCYLTPFLVTLAYDETTAL